MPPFCSRQPPLTAFGVPYGGKWKLNVAKSDFGQLTLVYEALPGGAYKGTMDGLSFTFTLDGKEVTDAVGRDHRVEEP